ncbi:MAG: hypothetical protein CGW95_04685 [Phenylobacterium zucineum]|nr:MAG: hypothetical protein CGW95_04685 [Phenylobacterium zucineum]
MKSGPILAAALLLTGPAYGGEKAAEKGKEAGKAADTQFIDLIPVAVPISANGRLVNYVFVSARINLVKTADARKLRAREPYFRDSLVRLGARTDFTGKQNYLSVDDARLIAALKSEAIRIAGPGLVKDVEIKSQTPKKYLGLPIIDNTKRNSEIQP